jgi:virulence-associated protein VagC
MGRAPKRACHECSKQAILGYNVMETAAVIQEGEWQTVRLPKAFHIPTPTVGVRQEGEAIVLEPVRLQAWPEGFFDSIHITDPAFARPDQGKLPPVRKL